MKKARLLAKKGQDVSFITIEEYHKIISSGEPEVVKEEPQINFELTVLKGKTFSVAGFSETEESQIAKSIECNGDQL